MKLNTTQYLILGALSLEPRHGYDIRQFLEAGLGDIWRVATSQLYAALKGLEGGGWISSRVEAQETRPDRRVFTNTETGRDCFTDWLHSPCSKVRNLRMELLSKLFFYQHLRLVGADDMLKSQKQALEKVRASLEKQRGKKSAPFEVLVICYKIEAVRAWLNWIATAVKPFFNHAVPRRNLRKKAGKGNEGKGGVR